MSPRSRQSFVLSRNIGAEVTSAGVAIGMLINERFAADLAKADAIAENISSLMASSRERELRLGRACQRVVLLHVDMHERFQQKGITHEANYYDWDILRRQLRLNCARQLIGKYVKIYR